MVIRRPAIATSRWRKSSLSDAEHEAEEAAYGAGLRYLKARRRSAAELERHLAAAGFDPASRAAAAVRLAELGLLDDAALAAAYIHDGLNLYHRGPLRLRWELRGLGLDDELIDAALAEHCPTELELGSAEQFAARRAPRLLRGDPATARRKLAGQLQSRGFSAGVIAQVLARHLEGED